MWILLVSLTHKEVSKRMLSKSHMVIKVKPGPPCYLSDHIYLGSFLFSFSHYLTTGMRTSEEPNGWRESNYA